MRRIISFLRCSDSYFLFSKRSYLRVPKYTNKYNFLSRLGNKYSSFRCCTTASKTDDEDVKHSFRNLLLTKLHKAHRSVVIEIPSENVLFEAVRIFEELKDVKQVLQFTSKSKKLFIIAEFGDVNAVSSFLSRCKSVAQNNEVPTFSRILKYVDVHHHEGSSKANFIAKNNKVSFGTLHNSEIKDRTFMNITEVLENVYQEEKLTHLESKLRFIICSQISDAFRGLFGHCEVLPFGSSVNGLGTHSSDLDGVLIFHRKKEYEDSELYFQTKEILHDRYEEKIIRTVQNVLNTFIPGIIDVEGVYKTRVPLVKFYHESFELNCDISTSNVSGVEMSELLFNCCLLDSRVRPLAYATRKWAKMAKITSDIGTHTISNFSLFLLLVFFLQTRPLPILPPLCKVSEIKGNEESCRDKINSLKSGVFNEETLEDLLPEFFCFLRSFDFKKNGISTHHGRIIKKIDYNPIVIENPLNRILNVSLNVSKNSFDDLRQAAGVAQKHLEVLSKNSEMTYFKFWKTLSSQQHVEV